MANSILGSSPQPNNIANDFLNQYRDFRSSFTGDPKQEVMRMLNSGRINKTQYDKAVQLAQRMSGYK